MAKKKITIDDLAVMTQKGFVELDSKMTVGFKAVGERFDKVETRLTSIESDIKALKEQIRILVGHIDALMGFMKKQEQENVFLAAQVHRLEERVAKLETKKR